MCKLFLEVIHKISLLSEDPSWYSKMLKVFITKFINLEHFFLNLKSSENFLNMFSMWML